MSIHRRAAKRDANEGAIVEAWRKVGASVTLLSGAGVVDALVGHQGFTYLAEIKNRKGKLTPAQIKFRDEWRGSKIYVIRTVEQGLAMLDGDILEG